MRHRAVERNTECPTGKHGRGSGKAGEIAGARREQSGLGAVCAPHAEVDQQFARRGEHAARGLGRDQGLKMQDVDQPRFDELRVRQRRGDAKDRLAREKRGALGDGVNLAAKAEIGKIIEEVFVESAGALEPINVGGREAKLFEEIKRLLQTGC